MSKNSLKLLAGWCKPSSLVSLALLSLASSPVAAQDAREVLDHLGQKVTNDATSYGSAATLLLAAIAALILLGFVAVYVLSVINRKSD